MTYTTNEKIIIGLIGEKLAGKDEVAKYLVAKYGAFHIKFSHLLDEVLEVLDLPKTRRNEIDLGLGLRQIFGNEVLYKALKKRIEHLNNPVIVINGIRMDEFERVVGDLKAQTLYITAPLEIRYQRYLERHEKIDDGKLNFEEFARQDKEELTERDIPVLGKRADYKIDNVGSLVDLHKKVDDIFNHSVIS